MRSTSSASVRIFWLDREAVLQELRVAAHQMKAAHQEIEQDLLFGSLARDEAVPGSDADLLLVLSSSSKVFLDRIPRYLPQGPSMGVDVFPCTQAEITSMLNAGNPFIRRALAEGISLA